MNPTKQLVEAANALIGDLINKRPHFDSFQNLCKILATFEQSTEQPEAIAGEKTVEDILSSCISGELKKGDFVYEDEAIKAMQIYASQQTALKDKQLQVQQSHIDDQDQLIFEQGKEIKELKAEVEKWQKSDDSLRVAYKKLERKFHVASSSLKEANEFLNDPKKLSEYIAGM